MARVEVHGASLKDGCIASLRVKLAGLPARTIDREQVIAWMEDGHSLLPIQRGRQQPALQLVRAGEADEPYVRTDSEPVAADALPELPAAR